MEKPGYLRVPLASNGLRAEDIASAVEVFESGQLTMGNRVKDFEFAMSSYLGTEEFVMMNSGSSANLAMIEAKIRPVKSEPKFNLGDGVLVPAIAWPTTIWPIIQLGLKPVFVDVDPGTLAIDLERAAEALRVSPIPIRGIFPIHVLGRGISSTKLQSFANEHNLELINDVCESLGSWENGTHAGTCGSGGSFSFYFSHHITTMEGGGVATNSLDFADDLRSIRSHGWSRDRSDSSDWKSDHSDLNAKFLFVSTGFNIRPMEVQAAIGLSQIKDISSFILRRRKLASMVNDVIKGTELELIGSDCLTGLEYDTKHSWMMLPIRVSGQCKSFTKDDLITFLESLGVETRPVLTGNFLAQPAMKRINSDGYDPSVFNIANDVTRRTLLIGAHHDFSDQQMDHIANCLKYFLETHQS